MGQRRDTKSISYSKGQKILHKQAVCQIYGKKRKIIGKTVIYARVSNNNQKEDLKNQIEFLRQYANAKGMIIDKVLEEIRSGLNYNRKKWNPLLEGCVNSKISIIYLCV